jgi:acyl-CoA thioester hydrolase
VKLPWHSRFIAPNGSVAAEARVELVLVELGGGGQQRRLLRHLPGDLMTAITHLQQGPRD